jgi:GNAT superfamily N-acetyltransferase
MTGDAITYRVARAADVPAIFRVRTSVVENLLTVGQLRQRGITNASVAASFRDNAGGWVAVHKRRIVGFSMADRETGSLFALFVLPAYERRGIGAQLLSRAIEWLWDVGAEHVWLHTAPNTKAAAFYRRRGWIVTGTHPSGDIRFEQNRPTYWTGGSV